VTSSTSPSRILDTIGNTPLVRLERIPRSEGIDSEILVKLEAFNPSGSFKDRVYKEMITEAVRKGDLKPGMQILEVSTGNAGISCSFVGTHLGYKVKIVMPRGMSKERKSLIQAFGGQLVLTPGGESDVDLCMKKIEAMMNKNPGRYWFPNQFENPENPSAHYRSTAPEIATQTANQIDCFVASQGSGGTLTGVGRYFEEKRIPLTLYAVEPTEAPILSHKKWGTHHIEGIGDGFVPKNLELKFLRGVVTVSSKESVRMAKRLLKEEGIFCGISSGCNVTAAVKVAKRHRELKHIVTMINDSGDRYLSTEIFGVKKKLSSPKRRHVLDSYSLTQLDQYQKNFEIIETK
jgi:cysteine synthase A